MYELQLETDDIKIERDARVDRMAETVRTRIRMAKSGEMRSVSQCTCTCSMSVDDDGSGGGRNDDSGLKVFRRTSIKCYIHILCVLLCS